MRLIPVLGVVVVSALVFAGCSSNGESPYPNRYLLKGSEIPDGLKLAEPPSGLSSNPARVPREVAAGFVPDFKDFLPDELWGEFFVSEACTGTEDYDAENCNGGIMLGAGYWTSTEKLDDGVALVRSQPEGQLCDSDVRSALLRDGHVIVAVLGEEGPMATYVDQVVAALKAKAPGLADVCA